MVGHSGLDVTHMRWGVRGRPPAVLLQDFEVRLCVKVWPPHQHLNQSTCINQTLQMCKHIENKMDVLYSNLEYISISNDNLCNTIYVATKKNFKSVRTE